jgi:hypothetical protein
MATSPPRFSDDERRVLQRVAERVVELRLEVPAILALETARPLSLVAGQAMIFFQPLVQALFRIREYQLFATLIERREAVDELSGLIESRADEAHERRRAERRSARDAKRAADDAKRSPRAGA